MSKQKIIMQLKESASVLEEMALNLTGDIEAAAKMIVSAMQQNGKLILFGNGGSAADAQHIAAEIVGRFKSQRPGLPALALTTNTSIITAVANDFGYQTIFARQVESLGRPEDIYLGISTSGNSPNVLLALKMAKDMGGKTIAFTGSKKGKLDAVADLTIKVPSTDTPRIQEGHITVGHILCSLIEEQLVNTKDN